MDLVNLDNYGYSVFTFTVDTKIRDLSKWETVESIGFEQIYRYLKARGYSDAVYRITDHPGVIAFSFPASSTECGTLVKELSEIYPNFEVKMV